MPDTRRPALTLVFALFLFGGFGIVVLLAGGFFGAVGSSDFPSESDPSGRPESPSPRLAAAPPKNGTAAGAGPAAPGGIPHTDELSLIEADVANDRFAEARAKIEAYLAANPDAASD